MAVRPVSHPCARCRCTGWEPLLRFFSTLTHECGKDSTTLSQTAGFNCHFAIACQVLAGWPYGCGVGWGINDKLGNDTSCSLSPPANNRWVGCQRVREKTQYLIAKSEKRTANSSPYSTQSAMKILVSCGALPLRFEAHTNRLPSEVNMGKESKSGE